MSRSRLLISAGAGAFLLSLLMALPAAVALRWLAPGGAQVLGASGSVWNGSAAGIVLGQARLGETRWSLSALNLLVGSLRVGVETRVGDGVASGDIQLGLGGSLRCLDCRFEGPVASLATAFPVLGNLDGRLVLELTEVEIRERWPSLAVGTARIAGLPLTAPGMAPSAGAPRADFEASVDANPVPEDGIIEVTIRDTGGPVAMNGRLVLSPPGNFEFSGTATAKPDAPPGVAAALSSLGRRGADGGAEMSLAGTF